MNNTNPLDRFWQLPLGIQLAAAALVVAVPRYVIAFLAADNLRFHAPIEGTLLGVSAIATAIIVAGGGAYSAHIVSSATGQAGKRGLLLFLWLVLLGCEIVLLAPPVVASLRKSELAQVLVAQFYFDALWSVVMVATPALCAAACVLAASLTPALAPVSVETPKETPATNTPQQETNIVTLEVAPSVPPQPAPLPVEAISEPVQLDELERRIIAIYKANPAASDTKAASQAGTTRPTLKTRVAKLQAAGIIHVNGVKTVREV